MDTLLWLLLVAVVLLLVIRDRSGSRSPRTFPVKGKIIYSDQGRKSKTFVSQEYRIRAKPDFLVRQPDGRLVLVEYKSREKPPNDSDVTQLIATAVAVRETYPDLKRGLVYTRGGQRKVDLSASTDILIRKIKTPLDAARAVKSNESVRAAPSQGKCRACGYRTECSDSMV